jgi:hypothetical protein
MRLLTIIIEIVLICYIFDRFCLWLERKGCLYYRNEKPKGGALGSALQELNAKLSPSNRYVIEMKQNEARFKKSEADVPSEPSDCVNEKDNSESF